MKDKTFERRPHVDMSLNLTPRDHKFMRGPEDALQIATAGETDARSRERSRSREQDWCAAERGPRVRVSRARTFRKVIT